MAIRTLRRIHEERAAAYSMYLLESNEPSEEKQLKILLPLQLELRVSTLLVMGMPLMNKGRSPC
jgi:hypothetical protein